MNNFSNTEFDCHFLNEGFTAKDLLDQKINEVSSSDDKDAFYVEDLGDILKKELRWLKDLPWVTPFLCVKYNDRRIIVKTLAATGTGFDCASKTEIQLVQSLGVPPERIIYANPFNEVELMKVAMIAINYSKTACHLSVKFGATLKTSSGCTDLETFVQVISDACCVFDMGAEVVFNILNIPSVINPALGKYLPSDSGVRIIAKSGRYYVVSAFLLAINIIAKNSHQRKRQGVPGQVRKPLCNFMSDGVYGTFNCILYDHALWSPFCRTEMRTLIACTVECCDLPEMYVGDEMLFEKWVLTLANMATDAASDFSPEVEEQDVSTLPVSCAWKRGMKCPSVLSASASINM
ncbi:unnamed protein product [Nyctereutes procyonoides]|uniref:Ornithine decarboxylase n=1 Tax=Nyctereutes procyonoides TaxID=34880 RepID=A0A811ZSD0_NYCPR|nr:unnamed protein product [Nyctereutes procyonoides]